MLDTIRKIETALAEIYNLELRYRAENFLIKRPDPVAQAVFSGKTHEAMHGALFLQYQDGEGEPALDIGIYLSKELKKTLASVDLENPRQWTDLQTHAIAIAGEEISHFQYLLYHALSGRSLSQLELEIQGDIDKFLLLYFSQNEQEPNVFQGIFARVFEQFSLSERLNAQQVNRYLEANHFASKCIHQHRSDLQDTKKLECALKSLRRFYRLGGAEKISHLAG